MNVDQQKRNHQKQEDLIEKSLQPNKSFIDDPSFHIEMLSRVIHLSLKYLKELTVI